ncbi:MAG: hypothetical protein A2086_02090 [Spirochaetes bacterium GWD1_27_9]|nr:MAG: hypothetical protein A2Z98_06790 [Spirochaetes bacterium GWB1_27_13]OHD27510.1 MAG: hypothetical protein A2Y34_04625 [Spirochaetes bacterium GWC1_27_15]OHD41704.1 MAG: hypothetical protein A2086_02090 [Spirochaetes bacterium GWD1_27_9]
MKNDVIDSLIKQLDDKEKYQIKQLQSLIKESSSTPDIESVSNVLPQAIALRNRKDSQLPKSLVDSTEKAIEYSIERDFTILSNILYPIIGSVIRKALQKFLNDTVQSMNENLEKGLTFQSLRWKIESIRTKTPYAEIVMLHTLAFRVEQVFLIHKDSGILLQHTVNDNIQTKDADMVSGMLTAIKDFAKDSFNIKDEDSMNSINVGEYTILIEDGPYAIIAAVVKGIPDINFRNKLQNTIEEIHLKFGKQFQNFTGDIEEFNNSQELIKECLITEKKKKNKPPILFIAIFGILLTIFGSFITYNSVEDNKYKKFANAIDDLNGVCVTKQFKKNDKYFIYGICNPDFDPLDTDFVKKFSINTQKLVFHWEYFNTKIDTGELKKLKTKIESTIIMFYSNSSELSDVELSKVSLLCKDIIALKKLYLNKNFIVEVLGHSAPTGNNDLEKKLSIERAEKIKNEILKILPKDFIVSSKGMGSEQANENEDINIRRSTNFKIIDK